MSELRLRLHDTMSGKLCLLVPRRPNEVRVYTCGPTTYDVAHVGHARAAIVPDLLVRCLKARGVKVIYVRNLTDVEDKILKRAGEAGEAPTDLSARMTDLYQDDMRALGCADPDAEPKVSEHIPDIISLIEKLIEVGAAYAVTMASGATDVYYAVRSFSGYGKLSGRNVEELRVGARIEASDEKRDPLDFALWKGSVGDAWGWESPWGKGRPGWHIECSAMASRYLGHGFDVHCGGMDLIFPHHENEIAQSEAAHPDAGPFASIWMHNGFVNIDKEKMAKSLGNFVTVRDVFERNDPEALRYYLLTVHYRGPIAFETEKLESGRVVFPGVTEAERKVDYIYLTFDRLRELGRRSVADTLVTMPPELVPFAKTAHEAVPRVGEALNDDLNTSVALAVILDVCKSANELVDLVQKRRKNMEIAKTAPIVAGQLNRALREALLPLGLLQTPADEYWVRVRARRLVVRGMTVDQIEARLTERATARDAKDFARSDAIRKELLDDGIEVADSPTGSTWRIAP